MEEEVQLVFRGGGRTFENVSGLAPEPRKERLGGGWEVEKPDEAAKREELEKKGKRKGEEYIEGSIDVVCMIDDSHFLSGGDSGSISLWSTGKKKPVFTRSFAHGLEPLDGGAEGQSGGKKTPRWITSLAALRGTNLFASGSWDGQIRFWALEPTLRSFAPASVESIPAAGVVNSISILSLPSGSVESSSWRGGEDSALPLEGLEPSPDADGAEATGEEGAEKVKKAKNDIVLAAALGQEPRLGRWIKRKDNIKNKALIAHIQVE